MHVLLCHTLAPTHNPVAEEEGSQGYVVVKTVRPVSVRMVPFDHPRLAHTPSFVGTPRSPYRELEAPALKL